VNRPIVQMGDRLSGVAEMKAPFDLTCLRHRFTGRLGLST
jgi:hypothetical protein